MALHKCTQKQLPIAVVGAGLPQLLGQAGRAKSYEAGDAGIFARLIKRLAYKALQKFFFKKCCVAKHFLK